jgi:hypothetical protein
MTNSFKCGFGESTAAQLFIKRKVTKMKQLAIIIVAVMLSGTFFVGCDDGTVNSKKTCGRSAKCSKQLCAKCGQIKGSTNCCKPNQVKCSKCSKVKGSPGCCKPNPTKCTKSDEVKSSSCCKSAKAKCTKLEHFTNEMSHIHMS